MTEWNAALLAGWLLFAVVAVWDRGRLRADKDDAERKLRASRAEARLLEAELALQDWRAGRGR